jgi:hypothetical protein
MSDESDPDEIRGESIGVVLTHVNPGLSDQLGAIRSVIKKIKVFQEQLREILAGSGHLFLPSQVNPAFLDIAHFQHPNAILIMVRLSGRSILSH